MFNAHKKCQNVAVGPAAETVESLSVGKYDERGCTVFMKRAPADEAPADPAQKKVLRHDILDPNKRFQAADLFVSGYPGTFHGRRREVSGRQLRGRFHEPKEILAASPKPDEEVGDIAAWAHIIR